MCPGPRPETRRAVACFDGRLSNIRLRFCMLHGGGKLSGGCDEQRRDRPPCEAAASGQGLSVLSLPTGLQDSLSDPEDVLDRERCLETLAALRHAKWFQVRT